MMEFGCVLLVSALLLRRWPLPALAVLLGGSVAVIAADLSLPRSPQIMIAGAAGVEICYLAATRGRRISAAGLVMIGACLLIPGPAGVDLAQFRGSGAAIAIIAWLIGDSIRQAQAQAQLRRAQAAAQTAMAERLRIARELHDIVAHSIGIIAIQAGAGRRVFDAQPTQARDALAAIEATSRETLSGLRRMVTGLRLADPDSGPAPGPAPGTAVGASPLGPGLGTVPLGPAPGLADVGRLAAMTLDAGVRVDVDWRGSRVPLPADIDLSAFRIIQEAVTNVVRHAGADRCLVRIGQQDGRLSIEVTDGGRGGALVGAGYGITGMRERAALLGGDFSAGPLPGGGFRVAARLPVPVLAR